MKHELNASWFTMEDELSYSPEKSKPPPVTRTADDSESLFPLNFDECRATGFDLLGKEMAQARCCHGYHGEKKNFRYVRRHNR